MTKTDTTNASLRKRNLAFPTLVLGALALMLSACGGNKTAATTSQSASGSVPFDRTFIDAMVPHHRSAIEMAKAAENAGLSEPDLIKVAANIVDSQQVEIGQMLEWRKQWYGSSAVDPQGADALGMSMEEMGMSHSGNDMSSAKDVNGAFASMMTDHHKGAIAMAQLALERAQHPEIKALAKRIIAAQKREIKVMKPHATGMEMG